MGVKYPKKMYSFNDFINEARKTQPKGKVKFTIGKKYFVHHFKDFDSYSIENHLGKTLWLNKERYKKEYR